MPLVFLVRKKTLASHITWHVTRQFHSVTRFGTGIASGGPALQTLVQCLVLDVLSYHWTGTLLGQRKCRTVVGLRWQSFIRLIKCPHILRIVSLPKYTGGVQPMLEQRRRR